MTSASSQIEEMLRKVKVEGRVEGGREREEEEEEEDGAREACTNNPLEIDLILSNMLAVCDFQQLAQCRLVCKRWFKLSLPTWLSKGPTLSLSLNPNLKPQENHLDDEDEDIDDDHDDDDELTTKHDRVGMSNMRRMRMMMSMNAFLQLTHNEFHSYGPYELVGLRQYKNFEVTGSAAHPAQHHFLRQFFRIYGPGLAELSLALTIPDLETYRAVILPSNANILTPNLVKLRASVNVAKAVVRGAAVAAAGQEVVGHQGDYSRSKLSSLQIDSYDYLDGQACLSRMRVSGWIQLLKCYPNLKTLILGVNCKLDVKAFDRMLEAIGNIRQLDRKSLDLRRLEISLTRTDGVLFSILPTLRAADLTLKTLGMSVEGTPPQTIAELLGSAAPTLEKLILRKSFPLKDFQPPELLRLQELELHGLPIPTLASLANFPNLQSLSLTFTTAYGMSCGFWDAFPKMVRGGSEEEGLLLFLPTLSKLHVHYGSVRNVYDPVGPEDVHKLAGFFPNLKDLQLWLHNDSLSAVLQSWSADLQHLTIIGNGVDDEGISGVASQFYRMKELRTLGMKQYDHSYRDNMGPTALTGKSLIKFLELPKLERLEVSLDAQVNVACELLRHLEENLSTFKLTRARKLEEKKGEKRVARDDDDEDSDYGLDDFDNFDNDYCDGWYIGNPNDGNNGIRN